MESVRRFFLRIGLCTVADELYVFKLVGELYIFNIASHQDIPTELNFELFLTQRRICGSMF